MYWPIGVPQKYSASTQVVTDANSSDNGQTDHGRESVGAEENGDLTNTYHDPDPQIIDLALARDESLLATITSSSLTLWSVQPLLVLVSLKRTTKSLKTYGEAINIYFRPDASTLVLRTQTGYLMVYSIDIDPSSHVYQSSFLQDQSQPQNASRSLGSSLLAGVSEVFLKFRKTIKIDADIASVLPLEQELVVATIEPAALQSIRWDIQKGSYQTSTTLLSKMKWLESKSKIACMVYDRAINLHVWINGDGSAFVVRRQRPQHSRRSSSRTSSQSSLNSVDALGRDFEGHRFYSPTMNKSKATLASINARFSLIALTLENGEIVCFNARDYSGNVPFSHSFQRDIPKENEQPVECLSWSPDGYCLFASSKLGWETWSVFGKRGASSQTRDQSHVDANGEDWLLAARCAVWFSAGFEMLMATVNSRYLWRMDFCRSAAVGCLSCANLVRALHQTRSELLIYKGHEIPDLTSVSSEAPLWQHVSYPSAYTQTYGPVRVAVISQDGKYVAIAGKRGLAHYSINSGRWRTFINSTVEASFTVKGGLCWFGHILAAATEHAQGYDVRLYSRDQELARAPVAVESISMPVAFIGPSGDDSLLVYTYENILYHFIVNITEDGTQLLRVGQIALHGLIRAPSRVRSISWILSESQLLNGNPAQDVETASVFFLIDDKLALLQSNNADDNTSRFDMRVIATQVEYYVLMRDQLYYNFHGFGPESISSISSGGEPMLGVNVQYSLRDSLWYFTGSGLHLWSNVKALLRTDVEEEDARPLSIPIDFYPLAILMNKAIVLGTEAELIQRKDCNFAQFRTRVRTQLFLPYVLRHHLIQVRDEPTAFALANQYQDLSYFSHALEILLHDTLESEEDRLATESTSHYLDPLPAVLSFLQVTLTEDEYLKTVVQCVRKTEVSRWKYIFRHLPSPDILLEQAVIAGDLKTASGFLIISQTLGEDEDDFVTSPDGEKRLEVRVMRLMSLAKTEGDFGLCSDLARFMMAIDPTGDALRRVVRETGFAAAGNGLYLQPGHTRLSRTNVALQDDAARQQIRRTPGQLDIRLTKLVMEEASSAGAGSESVMSNGKSSVGDYFSASPGGI